ncbi:phosphoadenosine phosphosulfate reductase family protein [Neobacillus notoginsengisoli]|uniref:phosphoadenosine phosphosulfate reductase domain-containing protein n=1 Tax=Neobacillus notoginsengisoli TaxID=1578198 RepID=UPI0018640200|nr:phosphoadenosine phosphosulfate reductase family protein [Neobacillus notoginsengisoli]
MRNHIIFFSGGLSSFSVADYVKTKYPEDNILLYFTDTRWENEDLYRFIHEASDKLQLPLLTHSMGLNPIELMFEQKVVFNSRIGNCSKYLKIKVAEDYLKKGKRPNIEVWRNKEYLRDNDFITNATLYFGIGFMESHRAGPIQHNWSKRGKKGFKVEFPLIDLFIDNNLVLDKYSIRQPVLYDMGFSHNNCNGCCVKAGMAHFKRLRKEMPAVFNKLVEQEHYIKLYVSEYHYIKNLEVDGLDNEVKALWHKQLDNSYRDYFYGRSSKPKVHIPTDLVINQYSFMKRKGAAYPLAKFGRDLSGWKGFNYDKDDQFDLKHDEGGCGCFVDYGPTEISEENIIEQENNQFALAL